MSIIIELPHVGESVVEGTIGKWLKQPGEAVKRYEPLVEIVTDKVTMEVPSRVEGSLIKLLAEEGETLPMGAAIAEVATADSPEGAEPGTAAVEVEGATPAPIVVCLRVFPLRGETIIGAGSVPWSPCSGSMGSCSMLRRSCSLFHIFQNAQPTWD